MPKKGVFASLLSVGAAIVFAIVVTLIVIEGAAVFYGKQESQTRGYTIDIAATPPATPAAVGSTSSAASASDKPVDIMPYLLKADLKLGEQIIKRCLTCHSFEKGKPNGVGPNQYGLVGRKMASVEGFEYSDGLKAKHEPWTFQALSEFLTSPQKYIPGTKMGFAGLSRPEERAAIIAYINQTFSDKPLEIKGK